MRKQIISLSTVFLLIFTGKLFISSSPHADDPTYESMFLSKYNVFALNLPGQMYFAGERVPLEITDVRERLDRELHVNAYFQSSTLLLIKRANRYFPIIRPILKKYGIPDDFKYLPLIESGFVDMVSPAGAEGPWQFLAYTGRAYGLEVNETTDERYHTVKSTEAACHYLLDAYKVFKNWTLAAASYNLGPNGLKGALQRQRVSSYYDLDLNEQTARYIFRVLAIKEIMEHPRNYGFHYQKKHLYQNEPVYQVRVDSAITDMVAFARSQGLNFKELRRLNPWIRTYMLNNTGKKTYYFKVPRNRKPGLQTVDEDSAVYDVEIPEEYLGDTTIFEKNSGALPSVNGAAYETYIVKDGEDIPTIAKKLGVRQSQLLRWNNLKKPNVHRGQVLKIYRQNIEKKE